MNITERYIKMCSQASEIQELWRPNFGDYYWLGEEYLCNREACRLIDNGFDMISLQTDKQNRIWLPQADQMFDLLGGVSRITLQLLVGTYAFYSTAALFSGTQLIDTSYVSLEELMLLTYMMHEHHKIWNEERWILNEGENK